MTNAERCDIINNVALNANRKRKAKARHSVSHKSEQKSNETEFTQLKKLKNSKNPLTNASECDIIEYVEPQARLNDARDCTL